VHSFHYRDGKLHCEEVDLSRVAEEFGTPLYVYSAGTILDHYHRLDQSLGEIDHLICYAVKANSNRAILKLLIDAGAGFDIVSGGELFRVLAAGGQAASCTFAGVGKSREEIEYALEHRVHSFNIESESELDYINDIAAGKKLRAPIALRINPDVDPRTHEYISTGSHENKFGIPLEQAAVVYERAAKMKGVEIVGVQMHIGSQITEAGPFAAAIEKVAPLVRQLKAKFGIKFFSIGGGMGIIYRRALESGSGQWWHDHDAEPSAFSVRDYANAILPPLRDLGVRILLEPGRFLVGNAGVLITRVRYLKSAAGRIRRGEQTRRGTSPSDRRTAQKKFAIVDAGMNDLIRPALYQSYHEIVPVIEPRIGPSPPASTTLRRGRQSSPSGRGGTTTHARHPLSHRERRTRSASEGTDAVLTEKIDIVGPVCESGDFFALDREMPPVHEGDLLAIMSAGAYGFVMASNYNSRPLPAEVLVRHDKFSLIRKRQTWEDLVRDETK
jgi:diaminopimelate decarboxylase